ncbi:MAG TPA: phage tail sheath subtilisin-like domain-containing protein [Euzebyales bacterium]|nr:phage tail sheath subtilisin-like domain-containing protein [Euzebyales bacterium]
MPQYLSPGVYVEEMQAGSRPIEGVGTAVAAFVGLAESGPYNEPTLVTNWSQFTQVFGEFIEGSYLAAAVYGYFMNGGGACYVVRVGADGAQLAANAELTSGTSSKKVGSYRVVALQSGEQGNDITVEVSDAADAKGDSGKDGDAKSDSGNDTFNIVVKRDGDTVEEWKGLTTKRGRQNAVTTINARSTLIRIEELASGGELVKPNPGSISLSGGGSPSSSSDIEADDYVGNPAERIGVGGLEAIDTVTMVCAPDLMAAYQAGQIDLEGVQAVQLAMIAHCELMGDRIALLDPPPGLNAQQIREWRVDKAGYDSKYATLYWPWIKVFDPLSGQNRFMPPSGHIAGIWGRSDDERGVHKAPANEVVRGVVDLELSITKNEHDLLNPEGINCIRTFPAQGTRVWGARTLSSDPAWRYLNVRRLFNYMEKSILNGTNWVVFEPNDPALWARIRRTISSFLVNEWRKGALFGTTPQQAFYVKCDDETNPSEQIDAGMVVCEIGVAPVKPAEFVVFRLAQFSGGSATVAE